MRQFWLGCWMTAFIPFRLSSPFAVPRQSLQNSRLLCFSPIFSGFNIDGWIKPIAPIVCSWKGSAVPQSSIVSASRAPGTAHFSRALLSEPIYAHSFCRHLFIWDLKLTSPYSVLNQKCTINVDWALAKLSVQSERLPRLSVCKYLCEPHGEEEMRNNWKLKNAIDIYI